MSINLVYVHHYLFLFAVERFKEAVIHQRKKSAEELLQFVSRYPHLSQSAVFLGFIAVRCV